MTTSWVSRPTENIVHCHLDAAPYDACPLGRVWTDTCTVWPPSMLTMNYLVDRLVLDLRVRLDVAEAGARWTDCC